MPIPILREQAHLAAVSVRPNPDGYVRDLPLGTSIGQTARPSLATFVAGRSGAAGDDFPIDFAIEADTIPRHSFIAIENGMIPPGSLKGEDVMIGATAIELFDRYPVPRNGVIPGVILQAIAAETLLGGAPVYGSWPLPLLLAVGVSLGVLGAQRRRVVLLRTGSGLLALLALLAIWTAARLAGGYWFEIVPALALLGAAGAVRYVTLTQRFSAQGRQIDATSGLPNRLGLEARPRGAADRFVIAAQIDNFDALKLAVEDDSLGTLLHRIAERLRVASGCTAVYRTEERARLCCQCNPRGEPSQARGQGLAAARGRGRGGGFAAILAARRA